MTEMEFVLKYKYNSLKPVFDNLKNIKYAIIKGEPLSVQAYGKVGMRHIGDIDILISKKTIPELSYILDSQGFVKNTNNRKNEIFMLSNSHQTPTWHKNIPIVEKIVIDINYDIFWGEYEGDRIDINNYLSDTVDMQIFNCKVKVLTPIKALVQLILHHYKDMNSIYLLATRKKYDLNMFKDIYHLITNNPNSITPESLHKIGVEYKILSYIYYVLYFTNYIYNSPILNRYLDAIKQTDFNDIINYYGLCVSERKKWPCDISKRLYSENLYELIENDLSQKDFDKINLNKQYFSDIL